MMYNTGESDWTQVRDPVSSSGHEGGKHFQRICISAGKDKKVQSDWCRCDDFERPIGRSACEKPPFVINQARRLMPLTFPGRKVQHFPVEGGTGQET
eukprot:10407590-Heterocapsa_arctica.AAC.1